MSSPQSSSALQAEINRLRLELHTLKQDQGKETVTIADYILKRLEQLGVQRIFGVPGDFNLGFLDYIEDNKTIDWVGNCNELNAAYAADGYARVKEHSLGVLVTTFGVGELSAINGIAGAFSEMVPILHIVGVPNTTHQKTKPMLHHTLGDGRYDAYLKAASQVTFSQMDIKNKDEAASKIDQSLANAITTARPVYLTLPTDLVNVKISTERLSTPLPRGPPHNDEAVEDYVLELITKLFAEAKGDAVILVDACAIRHDVRNELKEFCLKTGFPVYAAPMGKTAVNENYERYGGIYLGSISHPDIKEKVEGARLILSVGGVLSDFNTGNFSYNIPTKRTIELHSDHTKVQYARFAGIGMKQFFPKLTEKLAGYYDTASKIPVHKFALDVPNEDNQVISHTYFWPRVGKFFQPKDVIVTETGTSNFGISDVPLPKESVLVSQIMWGSIGWSVGKVTCPPSVLYPLILFAGSALGAALAAQESGKGRTILFVGDGSLQLTAQEISTMMRKGATPIIFVLNNKGYTIERYIHGKHRKYNDIANWDYPGLLKVLGDRDGATTRTYTVNDKKELDQLLNDATFAKADRVQLVEVMMDALDAPRALKVQAEMSGKINAYEAAVEEGMKQTTSTA